MGAMWFNFNAMPPAFTTVALIGRYNTAEIAESLLDLAELLQQRGCAVLVEKETAANIGRNGFATADYAGIGARADLAVVLGGDGTIHTVANALVRVGLERLHEVAVIPFGTANDVAKSLGLPLDDFAALAEIAMSDHLAGFDLARVRVNRDGGAVDRLFVV